jgi:hypothetical protein
MPFPGAETFLKVRKEHRHGFLSLVAGGNRDALKESIKNIV